MLVRFTSKAAASVSMFEKDAAAMLKLMSHSGTIPSAIRAKDVAGRLEIMEAALEEEAAKELPPNYENNDDEDIVVPIKRRAFPLLELMRSAVKNGEEVMWDYDHSVI